MFLEHREKEENKRQATAGYDLTDAYAQISYCLPGEPCPKTISLQADQEQYLIPALLGRYIDQDLWVYGPKAQAAAATGEVFLADGLLTKAAHQDIRSSRCCKQITGNSVHLMTLHRSKIHTQNSNCKQHY